MTQSSKTSTEHDLAIERMHYFVNIPYLQGRMALEVEQGLDDADVALVDGDVQRRLPPLVAGVEVRAGARQQLHDGGLVPEGGVVRRAVAVLVLDLQLGVEAQQDADHLGGATRRRELNR